MGMHSGITKHFRSLAHIFMKHLLLFALSIAAGLA